MFAPAFLGPIGGLIGGVFHAIAGVVLGGLHWTIDVAGKFILATIGGLIRLLIPSSWANEGLQVMHWIVAVPNYAGTVTSPGGHTVYGFTGINDLRDLFMWIGAALLPLTLTYATSRAALGAGRSVGVPIGRVVGLAAVLVSYPWWWSQAAAAVNQLTHFVLALPPVSHGVYKLMQYAVGGVALGGWQLIDLFLMGAIGFALLGLIFLKVVIILLGALLYAIGPLMIALVPTDGGMAIARAWVSAASVLLVLPLAWSTILAVGALLVNDSSTAGPLLAGQGTIADLLGGLLLALAGLASLWLCIRAAREAGAVLRGQLGSTVMIGRGGSRASASAAPAPARRAGESLRGFPSRVARASGAALAAAGPAGAAAATAASGVARHGRYGLMGAGGGVIRTGVAAAAPGTAALLDRTRAGAAAVRMARAGTASWQTPSPRSRTAGAPHRASRSQRPPAGVHVPSAPGGSAAPPRQTQSSGAPAPRPVHAPPPVAPSDRVGTPTRSAAASRSGTPSPDTRVPSRPEGKPRDMVERPQRSPKAPKPRAPRGSRPRKRK